MINQKSTQWKQVEQKQEKPETDDRHQLHEDALLLLCGSAIVLEIEKEEPSYKNTLHYFDFENQSVMAEDFVTHTVQHTKDTFFWRWQNSARRLSP